MVGKIGKASAVIASVAWGLFVVPGFFLCMPAAIATSFHESPLCPFIERSAIFLIPIFALFTGIFILSIVCDDSQSEKEMHRQIELEKQKEAQSKTRKQLD